MTAPWFPRSILVAAVGQLYAAFAPYPSRLDMPACPHCVGMPQRAGLIMAPLAQLRPPDVEPFATKALTTWGDVDDLRHFLPRLLELVAADPAELFPPMVAAKLRLGRWRTWPRVEQAAVEDYFSALWLATLGSWPPVPRRSAVVCLAAVAEAVDDLAPFLEDWDRMLAAPVVEQRAALRHLAELVHRAGDELDHTGSLDRLFWTPRPAAAGQLAEWLLSPHTGLRLEQAAVDAAGTGLASEIGGAADRLEALQSLSPSLG